MPRSLRVLAILLVFVMSGAPAWLSEWLEDDCADRCADSRRGGCPDEGCGDCAVICSSCPRNHIVATSPSLGPATTTFVVAELAGDASERMPIGPPPEGVFHPPRRAG